LLFVPPERPLTPPTPVVQIPVLYLGELEE